MNIRKRILPVALAGLMVSASALATGTAPADGPSPINPNPGTSAGTQGAGGQVNFTGEITDVSCDVSTTSINVDLGKWAKSYFASRTETTQTPFTISVKNCPETVKSVAVLFDGEKDKGDSTLLKLTSGEGTASGVGIKLYNADRKTAIPVGTVSSAVKIAHDSLSGTGTPAAGASADLTFFANYKSDGASEIKIGKADSVSNFVMVYN
ncbi:fimbrial protein [Pantoea deleyi]|uniref:Type 1 fimbrial protein n=1 Tax=Pantoea deleyi TaxID=470932 RepID=A0A506QMG7_9GAMM|nr:fimbrial protein [Pantoea deleyi]ORM77026.1 fimbrial protein [Pantoea deleyi]TPV45540.1 type 1 fimbrial protein [Pantoea deleyi]